MSISSWPKVIVLCVNRLTPSILSHAAAQFLQENSHEAFHSIALHGNLFGCVVQVGAKILKCMCGRFGSKY